MGTIIGLVIFVVVAITVAVLIDRRATAAFVAERTAMRADHKQRFPALGTGMEAEAVQLDRPDIHEQLQGIHRAIQETYSDC